MGKLYLFSADKINFRNSIRGILIITLAALICGLFSLFARGSYAAAEPVYIQIDGNIIATDTAPEIKNGRTMVPIRAISEGLGYDVAWNAHNYTVIITGMQGETKKLVGVAIGDNIIMIDGKPKKMDTKPYIKMPENRAMIPLRVISEAMGCVVSWDELSRTVSIKTNKTSKTDEPNEPAAEKPQVPPADSVPVVPPDYNPYKDGQLIVALDPGHGKNTAGKRSPDESLFEYEFNRAVAYRVRDILTAQGINVVMTVPDNDLTDIPLRERTNIANAARADVFVSFHANAFKNAWSEHRGWEIYYKPNDNFSKDLAKYIKNASFPSSGEGMGIPFRGIKTERFFVIRHTEMPAVLIEHAFMTNIDECALLKTEEFRDKAARADAKGIMDFIHSFK